jgi:hypothetical protein
MLRIYTIYAPLGTYFAASVVPLAVSLLLAVRYLFLITFVDPTRSHVPSLVLAAICAFLGFLLLALGMIGDILAVNRRLLEELRLSNRRSEASQGVLSGRTAYQLIDGNGKKLKSGVSVPWKTFEAA